MSLDQDVAELKRQVAWLRSRMPHPLAGVFLDTASGPGDDVRVRAFGWDDGEHAFGPVRWSPMGGALPEAGDECVIVERDDGVWQVVAWWNDSQGTGVAQSALDALDARLDALEGTRTVRGIITTTAGTPTIDEGTGFSAARNGVGDVTITFTTPFSDVPSVTVTAYHPTNVQLAQLFGSPVTASTARVLRYSTAFASVEGTFHFKAVGPA